MNDLYPHELALAQNLAKAASLSDGDSFCKLREEIPATRISFLEEAVRELLSTMSTTTEEGLFSNHKTPEPCTLEQTRALKPLNVQYNANSPPLAITPHCSTHLSSHFLTILIVKLKTIKLHYFITQKTRSRRSHVFI